LIRENLAMAVDRVAKKADHALLRERELESRKK